jgi:hypothetical protein
MSLYRLSITELTSTLEVVVIAFVTGVLLAAISLIIISTTSAKVRKGPRLPLNSLAANYDSGL